MAKKVYICMYALECTIDGGINFKKSEIEHLYIDCVDIEINSILSVSHRKSSSDHYKQKIFKTHLVDYDIC